MKKIPLTRGKVALVDDVDYAVLSKYRWHVRHVGSDWYAERNQSRSVSPIPHTIKMHRVILRAKPGVLVDHKDQDGLNNQRSNLRLCTHSQNHANGRTLRVNKTSMFRGVHKQKNRWVAHICVRGKARYLGSFGSEVEAAEAYNMACIEAWGEFARPNEVRS